MARRVDDRATPVEDYRAARVWLFANLTGRELEAVINGNDPLPRCARLICDVFWISERQLVSDLRKTWKEVGG